ncbi:hypothetical protein N657DRAFT_670628 [Parathielavia appendiculata]|uniref:Uncharacterized protein n=1 Tax=Parathielavia appendiculata TaxID=2587402 RepID=A0AAN6U1I0_9PEZI|nr:hypothetical protein N657DRAFT_670628 [Parathielavia appendiculata]
MAATAIEDARIREAMEYYLLNLEGYGAPKHFKAYKPKQQSTWPLGRPLPGDLVDEGKLLLFMKAKVVSRAPQKGTRLEKQRKRRLDAAVAVGQAAAAKRRRRDESETIEVATTPAAAVAATKFEEDDNEPLIAAPALELHAEARATEGAGPRAGAHVDRGAIPRGHFPPTIFYCWRGRAGGRSPACYSISTAAVAGGRLERA